MDQPGPPSQALFAPFWSIMRAMKQTDPQFKLRLDEDLKAALTAAAKQNQRTLSAEIVARLQASFEASPRADAVSLEEIIGAFARMMQLAIRAKPGGSADSKSAAELHAVAEKILERLPHREER